MTIKIVMPSMPTELEYFAARELAHFIQITSGLDLGLVREYEPGAKALTHYIALGGTKEFSEKYDRARLLEEVGQDGYKIVSTDNKIFICGGADHGTLFGVYGLLKKLFNFTLYTDKIYTYDKKELEFSNWELTEIPDIPLRSVGIYPVHIERRHPTWGDETYCARMRLRRMDDRWGIMNHCFFRILPPTTYHEKHPDWYDKTCKTLCLTNEEMTREYIANMKIIIENTPDDDFYMIAMEDNLSFCDCENCKKQLEKYNGSQVAILLQFINKVVGALNEWLKETYPKRKVTFFTLAYYWAETPPVRKTAEGKYELLFEDLRPADNFGVLIGSLHGNANYPLSHEKCLVTCAGNSNYHKGELIPAREVYLGWKAIVNHVASWNYNLNFWDYLCPMPMWKALEENYRFLKKVGAVQAFLEAGCDAPYSNFSLMKIYCVSNLMWDSSLSMDTLIDDFTSVYYTGAEKEVREYFDYIHEHAAYLDEKLNRQMLFVVYDDDPNLEMMDRRFWSQEMLFHSLAIFDKALQKELTEEVRQRVLFESLPVKITLLKLYRTELEKEYVSRLIQEVRNSAQWGGLRYFQGESPHDIFENLTLWEQELCN